MRSQAIIDAVPIGMLHIGSDLTVKMMNAPARALFGEEALGRHYFSVLRQPALLDRIETTMRTGEPGVVRYLTTEVGREVVYRVRVSLIPSDPGSTEANDGVLLSFEDVTPFEEARQMRSDFVANVSHELRTPLTALAGFIETLQGPAADDAEARAHFLEIMSREAGRMNRLIQDLLSLARVEDMARERPTGTVDLGELARDTITALSSRAQERNVRLVGPDPETPITVPGDSDQLRQVLNNLIENAIKYGREGGEVRITLSRDSNVPSLRGPGVTLEVIDEGEGISQRHLGRLTERFYRVDTHRSRDMGGTGLGLAIVKHIVNRHRGRLRITSVQGEGSTFTVMLPLG